MKLFESFCVCKVVIIVQFVNRRENELIQVGGGLSYGKDWGVCCTQKELEKRVWTSLKLLM